MTSTVDAPFSLVRVSARDSCALVDNLFADPQVSKVQTDPAPDNLWAIRCYEKAGFRRIKVIQTPDGPALYMLQCRSVDVEVS